MFIVVTGRDELGSLGRPRVEVDSASDACGTTSYEGLISMVGLVHGKDTGCHGELRRTTGVGSI